MGVIAKIKSALRPFIYSPEIMLSEQFAFGHLEIYQRFFSFPRNKILLAELQHGWASDSKLLTQSDSSMRLVNRRLRQYPLLVWSRELENQFKSSKQQSVLSICSPWFLLLKNYEKLRKGDERIYCEVRGSALFFPSHSFPGVDSTSDVENFRQISQFRKFTSITTCLYWSDFLNPTRREHFGHFSKVTCVGLRSNAATQIPWHDTGGRVNFLYQLHKLISMHEYVICEELSTAAMAAMTLGKKVFVTKNKVQYKSNSNSMDNLNLELDNSVILSKYGVNISHESLGYDLTDNSDILNLAKRGFGFDISIDETREVLECLLGSPSRNFKSSSEIAFSSQLLW